MIEKTIAKRYAQALLEIAVRHKIVIAVEEEMLSIARIYEAGEAFRACLNHPVIARDRKKLFLGAIFSGKVSPYVEQFLHLLVDKGRTRLIPEIAAILDGLADQYEGVVRVEARTAAALRPEQEDRLRQRLIEYLGGRQVDLQVAEDPALIGGMTVRIGHRVLDGSVRRRMKDLREELLASRRA